VADRVAADSGLTTEHMVVIATLSTAVPLLVLVAFIVILCLKQRRKRDQRLADEEARMQNEVNAVKRVGDAHMIKNSWSKCINNPDDPDTVLGGAPPDLCYPGKQAASGAPDGSPVYSLQRTTPRSHKQLNTDAAAAAAHRQSQRASALLLKLDKDLDALRFAVAPGASPLPDVAATPDLDKRIGCGSSESPTYCSGRSVAFTFTLALKRN